MPIPGDNRAALDGFAVEASASYGASTYNPIRLPLIGVAAGDALPAGTDAVVPLQLGEPDDQANRGPAAPFTERNHHGKASDGQ